VYAVAFTIYVQFMVYIVYLLTTIRYFKMYLMSLKLFYLLLYFYWLTVQEVRLGILHIYLIYREPPILYNKGSMYVVGMSFCCTKKRKWNHLVRLDNGNDETKWMLIVFDSLWALVFVCLCFCFTRSKNMNKMFFGYWWFSFLSSEKESF
jgi:hypothetical protein